MKDLLLSGTIASGDNPGSHSFRSLGAPASAARWVRRWPAIAILAAAAFAAWRIHSAHVYFPRSEAEFLSGPAIDGRLDKLSKRLHDNPDDLPAMVESGVLLFQKGHDFYPDAVNELQDAWNGGAQDVRIFYYSGVMYQELGLYPFSIEQYEKFLRNRPDDVEVRLLVAKLLYQSGLEGEGEKGRDKDKEKDREADREKYFEDAVAQYQQLQKRLPRNPIVVENLALSLQALKRFDESKQELAVLQRFGPDEARRAHLYLAEIASQQSDAPTAMREYLQILPLEGQPDLGMSPAAIYAAIAENYDLLKAPALALQYWQKVLDLDKNNNKTTRQAKTRIAALKKQLAKKKPARSRKK